MVEISADRAFDRGRWRHLTNYVRIRLDLDPGLVDLSGCVVGRPFGRSMTTGSEVITTSSTLTDDVLAMLDLERRWWKHPGAKDAHIREQFDISPTVYYSRLTRSSTGPEAVEPTR